VLFLDLFGSIFVLELSKLGAEILELQQKCELRVHRIRFRLVV